MAMSSKHRLKRMALVASFATLFLSVTENTYAQSSLTVLEIPSAFLGATLDLAPLGSDLPTLIELNDDSTFQSGEIALVSLLSRQVDLARTIEGAKEVAKNIAEVKYGWGAKQFTCLDSLWTRESHWNYKARNRKSGAHGIPQALPATKMEIIGSDWRTNPVTQITWGLHYINLRYETPCRAFSKFKRSRYY